MWALTKLLGLDCAIYTWKLYVVITDIERNKRIVSHPLGLCVLLSSTMLIMRDEEGMALTAGNMFYNMLSARQALRR